MPQGPIDRSSPGSPAFEFSPDAEILHYRIIRPLGRGARGEVYLAEDTRLERRVALKFLPGWLVDDPKSREQLVNEAKAASKLNHPNIAGIYALEEYQGHCFFAMEYVDGITLKEILLQENLPLEKIAGIALDICHGLEAAHALGIIHRDIKPQNIMIDNGGRAKICDFGLALRAGHGDQDRGTTAGTMAYMSPEQALRAEVDHRSDIFSLGVVLYEMAAGKLPFEGEYEAALHYCIVNEAPKPLNDRRPDLPETLFRVIDKSLNKKPGRRYQSASEMAADLEISSGRIATDSKGFRAKAAILISLLTLFVVIFFWFLRPGIITPRAPGKILVVFPLQNLGPPEDQYFADAMTDVITTELAKVTSLKIISRTSAVIIAGAKMTIPQKARKSGFDYVLEGTVLLDKSGEQNRARINLQLIRAIDDTHLWADTYDRTVQELFPMQMEIAEKVTAELDIKLAEREEKSIGKAPTASGLAYDYFLRGIYYQHRSWRDQDRLIAVQMYEKAIEYDPKFALAYAMLAQTHSVMYLEYNDRTERRLNLAREAVDAALRLEPDLPQAHLALGTYYYSILEFDLATAEFRKAEKSQPHNSDILGALAGLLRRKGDFKQALSYYKAAFQVDPLSQLRAFDVGCTYGMLRKYTESEEYLDTAKSLAPDWPLPYIYDAWTRIFWKGDKDSAREILAGASEMANLSTTEYFEYYWWILRVIDEDYNRTLNKIVIGPDSASYYLAKGRIYHLTNDLLREKAYFDSARTILEPLVAAQPYDPRFHSELGLAYAGLNNKEKAISEGRQAVEILSFGKDAYNGQFMTANLAEIYVMTGEYDEAVKLVKDLLSRPGFASIPYFKADPIWAPILDKPQFKKLEKSF
jgi:TolB-like protein/Flp pilus assembly protein TadD/predicted Ser/Thr protein kinase